MNPAPAYATIDELKAWADGIIANRAPDFVIGDDYLRRWWVMPRNAFANVYLHEIRKSDDDRALHDHPWANSSLIISGGYIEHTPEGPIHRKAGDFVEREADALHRLEVIPGGDPCITLFTTGPKIREWGFACPQGWVPWQQFTDPTDSSKTGRGCGEHDWPDAPMPDGPPAIDTITRIAEIARRVGTPRASAIEAHSCLENDLGWNILDRTMFALQAEDDLDFDIPENEELAWQTVADIARTIERLQAEAERAAA